VRSLRFEGRPVEVHDGDTVASALFRAGVRTFTRSLKYHRRRGLLCVSGDCPNCLVEVDGVPGVRACTRPAVDGLRVRRPGGLPTVDRDLLALTDRLHRLMPVGFYYKVFGKPAWLWPLAERVIRRATGIGSLPLDAPVDPLASRVARADVVVVGAGPAGLAAARSAAEGGARVLVVEAETVAASIAPGTTLDLVRSLADEVRARPNVDVLERSVALGVYAGPMVPIVGPDELLQVEAARVIVATGAVESTLVLPGGDRPGVWLGRGAARMAGVHGVSPGSAAVVMARTPEAVEHLATLRAAGVGVVGVVADDAVADLLPTGTPIVAGDVARVEGSRGVTAVVVRGPDGERAIACDALVLCTPREPRDALLRMGSEFGAVGAGEVVDPGCGLERAVESGDRAGRGLTVDAAEAASASAPESVGIVCLCEDVGTDELRQAWREGFTNAETLKRYTTAAMGPCQGQMCAAHLAAFVRARTGGAPASGRTTARPPARTVRLGDLVGMVDESVEKRTSLHDAHVAAGATMGRSGSWIRPFRYGDPREEYGAVRERVGVMDVGTLGKLLVGGPDGATLLERVLPCRVEDLDAGRSRYFVALDDAGYVMDDGLVCALGDGAFLLTSTSGGAERFEAWLRDRADRLGLRAHVVERTSALGAINVAGPRARELLERLTEEPVGADAIPPGGHGEVVVAGVPCRAIRSGFVGELSFELHHPRSRGPELWRALLEAGADLGIRPHGLDALDVLRLEKGHLYLGQDTLPDDHPAKLGLSWVVARDKASFAGKVALERMASLPLERALVGLRFDRTPERGAPLTVDARVTGRITSCAWSPALGEAVGLGWVRAIDGAFPDRLSAGEVTATVSPRPFYDPEGARLRA